MPFVTVEWFEGRSAEQKAELARRITEAMTEVAGTPAEEVWIRFVDSPEGRLGDERGAEGLSASAQPHSRCGTTSWL